jgi:hypothetical protein
MSAPDADKITTCEKKRVAWNAGLQGAHSQEIRKIIGQNSKKFMSSLSKEQRNQLGYNSTFKGKTHTDNSRQKMRDAKLTYHPNRKTIMTPNGLYPSRGDVARAAGVHSSTVDAWMKKWPEHYYYIEEAK